MVLINALREGRADPHAQAAWLGQLFDFMVCTEG